MKLTAQTAYVLLAFSIIFEQLGTAFIEACDSFTILKPTIAMILSYVASYVLFSKALKFINLSVCYATWTALGTISAALIGLFAFGQELSVTGWIAIFIMGAGIFILNLYGTPKEDAEDNSESGVRL